MTLPKISIIVPVYNAERFLERCLESIFAQTLKDYEVILVNDGSSDNSLAICREYAEIDSRIKVITKENGGAGSARNMGIEAALGEYLAFPDVDDWFDANMYEDLYKAAKEGDFDVVFSGVNYFVQTKSGIAYSKTENIKALEFTSQADCRRNIMEFFPTTTIFDVPWNKLYKRSVIIDNNIRFSDLRRCQDAMFNVDFFNRINKVRSLDKSFYNYMLNTSEDVQRKFPQNYIDICIAYYTHLIDVLKSWGVYQKNIRIHYDSSFVISIFATACMYDNPQWKLNGRQRKEYVRNIMLLSEVKTFLCDVRIRDEVSKQYRILSTEDVNALMMHKFKVAIKDSLRSFKLLTVPYQFLKNIVVNQ